MKDNYKELMNGVPYETVSKRIEDTVPDGDGEKTALSWTEMGNYAEVKDHLTIQLVGRKGNAKGSCGRSPIVIWRTWLSFTGYRF